MLADANAGRFRSGPAGLSLFALDSLMELVPVIDLRLTLLCETVLQSLVGRIAQLIFALLEKLVV